MIIPATPDCRPDYVAAVQATAWLVTNPGLAGDASTSHALTIEVTKADIAREGATLGVDYAMTVSCYQADANGLACCVCDSCRLR